MSAIQNRLGDIGLVLQGDDYLRALPELGAAVREVDQLMKLALCRFIKDRASGRYSPSKARAVFEQAVSYALKFWRLPDPRTVEYAADEQGRNILVVDDDPDVVDYLTHVLQKHDYRVVSARDAEEAMVKVETENPDLIVLDIMMPKGTEGFHFIWKLRGRSEPEYRNIPIIVLTSIHETTKMKFYPDESDGYYGPGEYLPVEGFMDKPASEEELIRQVGLVLKRIK
jgi:CheY-like chemotaxis protein